VTIETLAGRLNPNTAPGDLIAAVLVHLGMTADRALAQGAAVFDWHMPGQLASPGGAKLPAYRAAGLDYGPAGQPFENDAEIGVVLGMTPAVTAALRPFLSIYNERAIDPVFAAPVLRLALEETGTNQPETPGAPETVEIVAVAGRGGASFLRRAVVRFRPGEPFQILNWASE
jgi:general secretion pathway protein K